MTVDLRSDTVTRPTAAMRAAMVAAPVGDDVYGEDPTVNELERRVAELLGHEAALFTPTGSMANQLGLRLLVRPGQELLCDVDAHVVRAELGAAAALSGITTRTWSAPRGRIDAEQVAGMMRPDAGPYLVSTVAVTVEDTHNFGGGTVQPFAELERLREVTAAAGVLMHLDGARLWNAHAVTGVALSTYGRLFDTVSVCLSKGLGAPVGSLLAASAERVAEARVWRKRLGGGMRQVGILAAGGLHALDHHLDRLAEDHKRARRLAETVAAAAPGALDPSEVDTNIVVIRVPDAKALVAACRERGLLIGALDATHARALTHLDVGDDEVEQAGQVLSEVLASQR
ncbi:MAG: low specificity L-threonine aldolase [Sporichthyaceae bacterium]|nr:low specificity L-threonine aldolase [Sporichthyaceae bacterium]